MAALDGGQESLEHPDSQRAVGGGYEAPNGGPQRGLPSLGSFLTRFQGAPPSRLTCAMWITVPDRPGSPALGLS